ncbi:hypothetical protein Pfo_018677 [Paulownia fortunei]|nr:hypothetical protein Pfo_018677 [Paulownia fortunei]
MPEFGDELIIESYKVPWLIWIQLIVMILLIILLLFGFSMFTSDPSSSSSAASPSIGAAAAPPTHLNKPSSSHRRTKVEDQRVWRDEETSGELIREDDQSGEESSLKDSMFLRIFRYPNHPCNFIGLVKRALLKCFGLDSSSELSQSHRHEKQE